MFLVLCFERPFLIKVLCVVNGMFKKAFSTKKLNPKYFI